jgi:hypothetical protein
MLCDACIGVLQYRRNCLIRKTEFLDLDPNGLNDGDDAEGLTLGKSNSILERLGAENDEELEEELDEESEADERYMIIFGHHNSAMELEISAKWGCYICQTFWDKVEPHLQQELDHRVPSSYRINGPVFFTYAYLTQDENRDGIKLRIHTLVMSRYPSTFFLRPNYGMYRRSTTGCSLISAQMSHNHHTMMEMEMEMVRVLIELVIVFSRNHYTQSKPGCKCVISTTARATWRKLKFLSIRPAFWS